MANDQSIKYENNILNFQFHISGCSAVGSALGLGAKGRCPIPSSKKRGNARKTEEKRAFAV